MPPKASIGSEAIARIQAAHDRVVEARLNQQRWRMFKDYLNLDEVGRDRWAAAETEAAEAALQWETLLRSL